ncbi:MAG: methyl-accepting chemotaxis protein [Desulfovibrio sp.]|uniref:methyl-accepting chemotaxis protein n=1 Tax=Desulfovibrio sp. TaxID=885 RepID=UPI0025BDF823|nr:methyl-accepting chemotaxis protein [Desulfovibrio sp.]MBS6830334.1 methyl-accepting chemotaxis protein [Desulfovibrio sp.]
MTIRTRFLLAFIMAILLIAGGVISYVAVQMRNDAEGYYISSSGVELRLMNDYIEEFLKTAINNAAIAAKDTEFSGSKGIFPRYVEKDVETVFRVADLSPEARHLMEPLLRLDKDYDSYVEVYAGFADGSLVTTLDGLKFPAHFDMSKRPWYVARAGAAEDVGLAGAYTSMSGETVFAITHKIKDAQGRLAGVLGIDVTLKLLADKFEELSKGDNGYFVLIENTGKILCEPAHPALVGKVLGKDINDAGMLRVFGTDKGVVRLTVDGEAIQANVITNSFGWKLVSVQSEAAIYARSNATVRAVALITLTLALVALAGAVWVARSVSKPLTRIVETSREISAGNLDARLDPKDYYGELSQLQEVLSDMVATLKARIAEAREQSELAQKETARAQEAVQMAEEASERGAAEQASRVTETVTAMEEMNTTVAEVARNAGAASEVSAATRQKAEAGAEVVSRAVDSIHQVGKQSLKLKDDMRALAEQARSIDRIMGVISDIADQTNLLALNAAIEAARAGEAGRGFAVVADEVRKLAEKTMASTTDVDNAIKAIQQSAAQSAEQVDAAVRIIGEATEFAGKSGEALQQIVEMADSTADQVRAIATASEQQSASSEEINHSIIQVNAIAGDTAQAMQAAAEAVTELAEQTRALTGLIDNMKES